MTAHGYQYFSKEIGLQYCLEELGGYLSRSDMKTNDQTSLRAARMLITYLENGDFEYRAPRVDRFFPEKSVMQPMYILNHVKTYWRNPLI